MQCLKSGCLVFVIREQKLSDDFEYTCAFMGDDRILYFPVCGINTPYILFCSRTDLASIKMRVGVTYDISARVTGSPLCLSSSS